MPVADKALAAIDLKQFKLPPDLPIVGVEVEEIVDWSGDDALRVWLILDESADAEHFSGKSIISLKSLIHKRLLQAGVTLFPYVKIAKASERIGDVEEE
jgi:hypothetical protein